MMLRLYAGFLAAILLLPSLGCSTMHQQTIPQEAFSPPMHGPLPRELAKVTMPEYVIEPPDILVIEATQVIPKPPYRLRTGDQIQIQIDGVLPHAPVNNVFLLMPGGVVDLRASAAELAGGMSYGSLSLAGMTVDEAREAIVEFLKKDWREPVVEVYLIQIAGQQQITGEHLVRPDGSISLGTYGSVRVVGLTLNQAKAAVEAQLADYLETPEVVVDIFSYNSKVYYVVTAGGGFGDQVVRLPITGNETVLDAMSQVNSLSEISSHQMWIARPTPYSDQVQILMVDWQAITKQGVTSTNYQLLPGDRLYIAADRMVAMDTAIGKFISPFERVMGFSLLGVNTVSRFTGRVLQNQGNFGGGGFFP
jgi:polysaccharide biosynthesis/export protein